MNGEISWEDRTEQKFKYTKNLSKENNRGFNLCFGPGVWGAVWALLPTPSPRSPGEDLRRISYIISGLGLAFRKE